MTISRRTLLFTTLGLPALAACSSTTPSPATGEQFASVTHLYGTTPIPAKPQRIATVSWVNADTVLAFGVVPVAMPTIEFGGNANGSTDWIDATLKELGGDAPTFYSETDGINAEAIAAATPDLIVAAYSGLTQEEYTTLSAIAPTIGPIRANYLTSWQEAATAVGTALGEDPKPLISTVEKQIADAGAQIPDGTTFIASNLDLAAGTIALYAGEDTRSRLFTALGMTEAGVVAATAPKDTFYVDFSPERADELVSDVIYSWLPKGTTPEQVAKHPLFGQIPAVKAGKLISTSDDHATLSISAASALSLPWAVEHVIPEFISTITA